MRGHCGLWQGGWYHLGDKLAAVIASEAWECVSLKSKNRIIYAAYKFFVLLHLLSFKCVHIFGIIHQFSHLPPSTTNPLSLPIRSRQTGLNLITMDH